MKKHFLFWSGDVNWLDYGGTWIRQVSPRRFHFIQVTNMDDACGRDNEGRETYVVELSEVDLDSIPAGTQESAWRSCDGESQMDLAGHNSHEVDNERRDLVTAGCCFDYGARAPLHEVSTNNAHAGFRECRKQSYLLTRDASAYAERMERPVNKLGSTAREYMQGDITSAVVRGVEAGDAGASLVARVYVNCDGQTLGGRLPAGELEAMKTALEK